MSWSDTLKKQDSYFPPQAVQQKIQEIQTQVGTIRRFQDLYNFILGLKGSGLAAEAWEKSSQGGFSLSDQIRAVREVPVEEYLKKITFQVPGLIHYNMENQIPAQIINPLSRQFSRTFGLRDKAIALMKPHLDKAIRTAKAQQTNKSSFEEGVGSWFDVVKLDPLEHAMRMRSRLGSKEPEVQDAKEECAKCGSSNFMRGDSDPEGKEICALCRKRFYDEEATS